MRTFASGWSWPRGSRVEEKAMVRIWEYLNGFTQFATVLISSIALLFHLRWSRRASALGPTILTTLGIFFCFAGIAWGLLDFDPNDVRSRCGTLLRTSFGSKSSSPQAMPAKQKNMPSVVRIVGPSAVARRDHLMWNSRAIDDISTVENSVKPLRHSQMRSIGFSVETFPDALHRLLP